MVGELPRNACRALGRCVWEDFQPEYEDGWIDVSSRILGTGSLVPDFKYHVNRARAIVTVIRALEHEGQDMLTSIVIIVLLGIKRCHCTLVSAAAPIAWIGRIYTRISTA